MTECLADIARKVHEPDARTIACLSATSGDLVVLGAGGKMGVSLARMAAEAFRKLPGDRRVFAISRFSDHRARAELSEAGVHTIAVDLADDAASASLPPAENVVYMIGRKFGTTQAAADTWATNTYLPGIAMQHYAGARVVAFSSGNVYPLVHVTSGGADEDTAPSPVGEYAQSCLGRERILAYHADRGQTPLVIIRLNYAVDCRYGVLTDIARAICTDSPVDLSNALVNVIWQGDANRYALSALTLATETPTILNVAGPETASVRWLTNELARRLGREPRFTGAEAETSLLSNAARCFGLFGYPLVSLHQVLDWTSDWLTDGGRLLDKPTHFSERAGNF